MLKYSSENIVASARRRWLQFLCCDTRSLCAIVLKSPLFLFSVFPYCFQIFVSFFFLMTVRGRYPNTGDVLLKFIEENRVCIVITEIIQLCFVSHQVVAAANIISQF